MMRYSKITLAVIVILIAIGAVVFAGSGQRIRLIADDRINVMDQATVDPAQTKVIGTIQPGEEVPVLSCVDLKSFIAPEIKLADGKRGYVLTGKFHLKREPFWSSLDSPIVFSC